jgi:D-arabinono-1,4-lactone oxidase
VLVFHLYEVPLVSFNGFFAWYGLKRFSVETARRYMSLLNFVVIVNLAFFTFETGLLLDGIRRKAPLWETLALSSVALILVTGSGLGIYVKQRMEKAVETQATGKS